jgi:hypothetical protein
MSAHGLRFRFGVSLGLALVCGSAALARGPLFPGQQYEAGDGPRSIAVGDLNRDERIDLAVANFYNNNVSVLLNQGGRRPGDVDGDLDVDLAAYGACEGDPYYNPNADFDASGCVDLWDLLTLLDNYGART